MQFLFDSDDSANPERNCLHTAAWQPPKKDKQGNKRERERHRDGGRGGGGNMRECREFPPHNPHEEITSRASNHYSPLTSKGAAQAARVPPTQAV
eukprot:CAMPEP_0195022884 /NCGR_PEP_ID=MMETSP0326_2-20130528/41602_1 /TAXON_ID=2866 ORGANISM="Crypthecodinium cohnii, Strain Seligo" /NCGR_SAMPLE_ID=MMETSP0326_2 /ASSEMBLY_ACC=CAM_ASM_000348 /LENGTH=94 /DNA_ID=CAMNT_0040042913 /DNA_START=19 /DNA_END=300 /DNA_ORIENTATION=+